MKCPHANIAFCPLYHAAHVSGGCDDGRLEEGGCAVDRGMDYQRELARLNDARPDIVAAAEWAERKDAVMSQRARNRRYNGIH